MKRVPALLCIAALGLTSCTDQPVPSEPTATVSSSPEASDTALTDELLAANIAEVLADSQPDDVVTGGAALEAIIATLLPAHDVDDSACLSMIETIPEVAGFARGTAPNETEEDEAQSLGALGFSTADDAEAFTTQLDDFVKACPDLEAELEPLNHHTDDAFEVKIDRTDDTVSSVVLLRDDDIVLVASSTPPADVALSLTLADQLQEMLR